MKSKNTLVAVTVSLLLVACGGGGGGSTPTATPPTPPVVTPPVTSTSDLQTTIPALTYATGSQEAAFVTAYNDFRSSLGLGKLAQDARLDLAAQNHVKYHTLNPDLNVFATDPKTGRPVFHIEDPARPGFTGIQEIDRAAFAKYSGGYVGESAAFGNGHGAVAAFNDLVATVYHRAGLMFQFPRDIGVAIGSDSLQSVVMEYGYQAKKQFNAPDYFGFYPADKQTAVALVSARELPNPYPEITQDQFETRTSYPINVVSTANTNLTVTTFTVTAAGDAVPLSARILTKDNDPNKYLESNTAYLVGNVPFKANTVYTVAFSGSANGIAINKTWTFTTRP